MNIAICIRGSHFLSANDYNVDFETNIKNFKYFLLDALKPYNIDIFISTYKSSKIDLLINTYNPVSYFLKDFTNNKYAGPDLCNHHNKLNELVIEYENLTNKKYDLIINTRFDFFFFKVI
jgi:hypothetical protein